MPNGLDRGKKTASCFGGSGRRFKAHQVCSTAVGWREWSYRAVHALEALPDLDQEWRNNLQRWKSWLINVKGSHLGKERGAKLSAFLHSRGIEIPMPTPDIPAPCKVLPKRPPRAGTESA